MQRILIVDDEAAICWSLERLFRSQQFEVSVASSAEQAFAMITSSPPDVVLLDVRLPGISGLNAITRVREIAGEVPIVLMTAFCDLPTAIAAFDKRVAEYLPKPFDLEQVLAIVRRLLANKQLSNPPQHQSANCGLLTQTLVGRSLVMQEVYRRIALATTSSIPVLITGESGTGKELVAQAIHTNGPRKHLRLHAVALPTLTESLLESELFGHAQGAFTGATERREGLFGTAGDSTILLDEIGELPMGQQAKLLRVLESGEYTPIGTTHFRRSGARVLAATNRNLREMVREGRFREDLYFRLAVFEISLPPLRDRRDDIPELCMHLLSRMGRLIPEKAITQEALAQLSKNPWRGNVRELRNALEQANLVARDEPISLSHISVFERDVTNAADNDFLERFTRQWIERQIPMQSVASDGLYDRFLTAVEPVLFKATLDSTNGNLAAASQLLGIHRGTLRERLKKYAIDS